MGCQKWYNRCHLSHSPKITLLVHSPSNQSGIAVLYNAIRNSKSVQLHKLHYYLNGWKVIQTMGVKGCRGSKVSKEQWNTCCCHNSSMMVHT